MEGIGWGWLGLGLLHMVVFWVLVSVAFAALFRWRSGGSQSESNAMDILNTRYANGEFTREQFGQLKREIGEAGK
jgi:uncharacterized membrane protein